MSHKHTTNGKRPNDGDEPAFGELQGEELSLYYIDYLTPEDHVRLADQAEDGAVELEVVLEWLNAQRKRLRSEIAKLDGAAKRWGALMCAPSASIAI